MITFESVSKIYSSKSPPAVNNLDIEMKNGEILGMVGLNGAGKTTTIRMSSGIILPTSGRVLVDNFDIVKDKVKAARNVGWIPELPNFEPNATPVQLMNYYAGFYNLKGEDAKKRIYDLLEEVGLKEHLKKKLKNYSQGMKKRFSIAESILGDPNNILFDETLNGLDPEGVLFVRNLMLRLKKEGKSILLSSHILSEIEDVADRIVIIDHGNIIKIIKRNELKSLGKTVIHMSINNMDENFKSMISKYGEVEINDGEVVLRDLTVPDKEIEKISKDITGSGYGLYRFNPLGESLEEYFFSLIGVKK